MYKTEAFRGADLKRTSVPQLGLGAHATLFACGDHLLRRCTGGRSSWRGEKDSLACWEGAVHKRGETEMGVAYGGSKSLEWLAHILVHH